MRVFVAVALSCLFFVGQLLAGAAVPYTPRTGDVIFQTSKSNQSWAIMWATKSLYSHVGIIDVSKEGTFVVEAIQKVSRTPLKAWIQRGHLGRYAIFSPKQLSGEQRSVVIAKAKSFLGRPYDIYFHMDDNRLYCSELVYQAFLAVDKTIGTLQQVKDLDVDNALVRKLFSTRWRKHPACRGAKDESSCWSKVLEDKIITPDSQALDEDLEKMDSNYP